MYEAKSGPSTEFLAGQSGVVTPLISTFAQNLATRVFSTCPSRIALFTRVIRLYEFYSLPHVTPAWCPGLGLRTAVGVT